MECSYEPRNCERDAKRVQMQKYLRQGELQFSAGYKMQTRWGAAEAAVFALECAGASLFATALFVFELPMALAAGIAMVALAVFLLFAHLGHPARAWRALGNLRESWISRGTVVLGGFLGLGILYCLLRFGAGMEATDGAARVATWLLLGASAFILVYPGLVLSASPAIPFWSSGLLPVMSAGNGMTSGLALFMAIAAADETAPASIAPLDSLQLWLLVALSVVLFLYVVVMIRRGGTAKESAGCLLTREAWLFGGAGCALGLGIPMAIAVGVAGAGSVAGLLVLAAVARLCGDFAIRYAFLRAGMFSPLV